MPAKKSATILEQTKTSHMSKKDLEARKNAEVNAPSDNIVAPDFIKGQKEHNLFKKYVNELLKVGIIANIDANALGRLVLYNIKYNEIIDQERQINIVDDYKTYQALQKIESQLAKDILTLEREFGMTSNSRSKMTVIKPTEPKVNPLLDALKGGA